MKKKAPKGLKGLRPKWHQSTLSDINRLKLPLPDHDYGYSCSLLKKILSGREWIKFVVWMEGQTCMVDEVLGIINYTHDVIRGLDYIRNSKATFWD